MVYVVNEIKLLLGLQKGDNNGTDVTYLWQTLQRWRRQLDNFRICFFSVKNRDSEAWLFAYIEWHYLRNEI